MIKGKQIIEAMGDEKTRAEIREKECFLCEVHTKAADVITVDDWFACPNCGQPVIRFEQLSELELIFREDDLVVLGESNSGPLEDESFRKVLAATCSKCDTKVALIPEAITYNANHDIHYTGGRHYVQDSERIEKAVKEKLQPQIENFVERLSNGEKLEAWNLAAWLRGGIESIVSEYLYTHGIKK